MTTLFPDVESTTILQTECPEKIGLLALSSLKGVGFETLRQLAERGASFARMIGDAETQEVLQTLRDAGARIGPEGSDKPWQETREKIVSRAHDIMRRMEDIGAKLILRNEPQFPAQLFDLRDTPHWLFVQGDETVLPRPSIAVVGTREPTADGIWLARNVGYHLADWGAPTVSGLALGIDQEVHRASLRARVPTVAVLGTGIFSDYPRNSEGIRAEIVGAGGAILTEYLPSESYSAKNFVKRNRLQAALARTVVPVEWSLRSGTAHTVRYATSLHRDLVLIRVPNTTKPDWVHSELTRVGHTFVLPHQESEFAQYVMRSIRSEQQKSSEQLSLF